MPDIARVLTALDFFHGCLADAGLASAEGVVEMAEGSEIAGIVISIDPLYLGNNWLRIWVSRRLIKDHNGG